MDPLTETLNALEAIVEADAADAEAPVGLAELCRAIEDDLDGASDKFGEEDIHLLLAAARLNPNIAIEIARYRIALPAEVA